mmetsp:Transcript_925/g.2186  ORF Transcript_925/g.2186 Transcript_925/m.2186 type:complete len:102 (+) Transcript_925:201-506(+)
MLIAKADAAYPGKFQWILNDTDVLKKTVPAGKGWYAENQKDKPIEGGESALWRKGSFEIMRMDNNDVLYSKIINGDHLVDGKGGPEGKLGQFVESVLKESQ